MVLDMLLEEMRGLPDAIVAQIVRVACMKSNY